jgi:hypothetical protein
MADLATILKIIWYMIYWPIKLLWMFANWLYDTIQHQNSKALEADLTRRAAEREMEKKSTNTLYSHSNTLSGGRAVPPELMADAEALRQRLMSTSRQK